MTQTAATLHITNGDGALYLLKKAGVLGTHVAWQDALNVGPVPAGLSLEETTSVRTRYFAGRGYDNPIKLIHDFERRDAMLRRAREYRRGRAVVRARSVRSAAAAADADRAGRTAASTPAASRLVQSDHYLASITVDEILALLPKRRTATAAIFQARRAAIGSDLPLPDADSFLAAAGEDAIGSAVFARRLAATVRGVSLDARRPFAFAAPSALCGRSGGSRIDELFARSQAREEATFLSERAFAMMLEELRAEEARLSKATVRRSR